MRNIEYKIEWCQGHVFIEAWVPGKELMAVNKAFYPSETVGAILNWLDEQERTMCALEPA